MAPVTSRRAHKGDDQPRQQNQNRPEGGGFGGGHCFGLMHIHSGCGGFATAFEGDGDDQIDRQRRKQPGPGHAPQMAGQHGAKAQQGGQCHHGPVAAQNGRIHRDWGDQCGQPEDQKDIADIAAHHVANGNPRRSGKGGLKAGQ